MMKNRSIALLLLAGCLTLAPLSAHAGIFDFLKRKKKPAKTEKPVEKTPYERILTSGLGVQLGLNTMPRGGLPLVPAEGALGLSEEYSIDFRLSSFALTPELRWYTGGGYGHGFYLMAYYRFQNYSLSSFSYDFHVTPESGGRGAGGAVVAGVGSRRCSR